MEQDPDYLHIDRLGQLNQLIKDNVKELCNKIKTELESVDDGTLTPTALLEVLEKESADNLLTSSIALHLNLWREIEDEDSDEEIEDKDLEKNIRENIEFSNPGIVMLSELANILTQFINLTESLKSTKGNALDRKTSPANAADKDGSDWSTKYDEFRIIKDNRLYNEILGRGLAAWLTGSSFLKTIDHLDEIKSNQKKLTRNPLELNLFNLSVELTTLLQRKLINLEGLSSIEENPTDDEA